MNYTAQQFIADQLKAANPGGDWNSNGVDRAAELAAILYRNGIIDLSKLAAQKLDVTVRDFPWAEPRTETQIALVYEGKRFGYLGTPDEPANDPYLKGYVLLAWSAAGHGHVSYVCRFGPSGFTIVPVWGSSSDWGTFREAVRLLVTAYVMYLSAGTASGAGGTIGASVMGASFAASFPALTSIIGNIALGAYFSGGNVKGAVRSVLLSQVAGGVGDIAGRVAYTATQIEILGKLADVAVSAFVRGGDVDRAVTTALLQNGFSSMDELINGTPQMFDTIDTSAYPVEGDSYAPQPMPAPDIYGAGSGWGGDTLPPDVVTDGSFMVGDAFIPNAPQVVTFDPGQSADGFNLPAVDQSGQRIETPVRSAVDMRPTNLVNDISNAMLQALRLTQAWDAARHPQVNTQARAVTSAGVVAGSDSGVVLTRRPDGTTTAARPPVGVPQSTTTGNLIVNNGDGTYTLIAPDGTRRVIRYGENTGNDGGMLDKLSWPVILGGAGLLFSVFK